jgi:hypothetical protein
MLKMQTDAEELIDILFRDEDDLSTSAAETKGYEMLPCFSLAIINLATSPCENRTKTAKTFAKSTQRQESITS